MTFRLLSAQVDGREVAFNVGDPHGNTDNSCTILIGRNGVGKSRLLAEICRVFASYDGFAHVPRERPRTKRYRGRGMQLELAYVMSNERVTISADSGEIVGVRINGAESTVRPPLPRRVIATTITPSDKFPYSESNSYRIRTDKSVKADDIVYRYMGGKSGPDSISTRRRLSRVADALIRTATKAESSREKVTEVFGLLNYQPYVDIEYEARVFGLHALGKLLSGIDDPNVFQSLLKNAPLRIIVTRILDRHSDRHQMQALRESLAFLIEVHRRRHRHDLTVSVDIKSGTFLRDGTNTIRHLRVLESFRIVDLVDIGLYRRGNHPQEEQKSLFDDQVAELRLSVADASSGEQAVLLTLFSIAAEIEDDSLIFIDEPEISLHPEWQEKIIPRMVSSFGSYRGCHFVIATHSPQVLAQAGEVKATVIVYEERGISVISAVDLSKKSADYQLAAVFNAPGYRNEYLARQALAAMHLASRREFASVEFLKIASTLTAARAYMNADDPVAQMIDAILQAAHAVRS